MHSSYYVLEIMKYHHYSLQNFSLFLPYLYSFPLLTVLDFLFHLLTDQIWLDIGAATLQTKSSEESPRSSPTKAPESFSGLILIRQ